MKSKRLLLMLLVALLAPWAAMAQSVTIGEGTSTSQYLPSNSYFNYAISQQIYTADEIDASGTITSISFYNTQGTGTNNARKFKIYMAHTDKSSFTSTSDWIALTSDNLVYEVTSAVTLTPNTWTSLTLNAPFAYNGTDNLVVAVIDNSGNYSSDTHNTYRVFSIDDYQALYAYSDSYSDLNPDGTNGTSNIPGTRFQSKNQIVLGGIQRTCAKPTGLASANVTDNSATISWTENGVATAWVLQYGTDNTFAANTEVNVTTNPTTSLSGLTSLTTYFVRVKPDCDTYGTHWSSTFSFSTTAEAEVVGDSWNDDFEGTSCGWELINGTVTQANWFWGTAENSGSGSHSIYTTNDNGNTCSYNTSSAARVYAAKLLTFADGKYTFQFDWKCNGETASYDYLSVGLLPATAVITADNTNSGTLPTGWISVHDATCLNGVTAWQTTPEKTVQLESGNYYLVLRWRQDGSGGTGTGAAVDNVSITKVACEQDVTDLAVSEITTTSATLSWNGGEAEQWQVTFADNGSFDNATEAIVSAATYNMTGLQPSTNYYAKVRAYCGGEDFGSWSSVIEVLTDCEIIPAVGYTENFDSYTAAAGVLPICWNKINTTTYSYYQGYPKIYNYTYQSSPYCLYFSSYYSSYSSYDPQPQYAILPEMTGLAGTQVSLWARGSSATSTFKIGTMTDPADASTFVAITEQALTTSYQQFEYLIPANAQGNYLAIMIDAANSSRTSNGAYIDDITIAEPPACPKPTVLTVVANSVTAHSVQLSWVSDATAWIVAYKTAEEDEFTKVNATENPFTLTGLTDGMTYTAKVCAVCDGTPGEWTSTTVSFTTPIACPAPTNLAYSGTTGNQTTLNWSGTSDSYDVLYRTAAYAEGVYEQFNTSGTPSGWTQYSGLVDEVIAGTATLSTGSNWNTNSNALGTYNIKLNIFGTGCKYWLVTPEIDLSQNLSFDLALTDYGNADPIEDATAQADDRFVVLIYADNAWTILREWNNTGSEYVYNTIATTGEHVDINLSAYFGKTVKIAFYGESTESGGDNDLHIDNVLCGILHEAGEWQTAAEGVTGTTYTLTGLNPETDYEAKVLSNCEGETGHETIISFTTEAACMVPTELTVVSVTTTTAELTWTSSSTAWQIQVNEEEPIDVTSIPYTLEGLTPATTYTFKVRANCDGSYTDWSNAASFTTDCDAITTFPWSEDFESYSASSSGVKFEAPCWVNEHISGSGSYFFEVYSGTNGTNSTKQLRLRDMSSGTMTKLMLPEMTLPGNDYLFSIDVYRNSSTANYGEGIRVFVSTDGEIEGATELAFISRSYATSDGNLIPAESASGWYTYELPFGISGTCYIILRGESLYGSSTYMDNFAVKQMPTCLKPTALECTATATTTATFSWTNGAADQTAWQICLNGDEENLIMAESNPFTIEDLSASTAYTAKVRAYCSADDQSDWTEVVSFTTECEAVTSFPWSENFNSLGMANSIPNCWDNSEGTTTNDAFKWSYQGGDYLKFNSWNNSNGNTNFLKTPVLSLPNSPMQLSFRYKNPTGGDFSVFISTDGGATYTTSLFTGLTDQSDWEQKTYDLTSYAGEENVVIVFGGTSNYGSGDAYLYLDDVEITYFFTKTIEAVGETEWANGKGGYYFIASPVAEPVTPTANNGFIVGDYDLYYFSQATDGEGNEWINFKDETLGGYNLTNGKGYLYASKEGTTLTFTGTPGTNGTVTLDAYDADARFKGWNLIGNPFAQDAYITKDFYTLENSDTYTPNEAGVAIHAMQGLLVVADNDEETLTFSTEAPAGSKVSKLNMNVSKDSNVVDHAIISFSEGHQLPKLQFRQNSTKVYLPKEGKDYAITSVEGQVGEVPVSFKAENNGTYSLSFTSEEVSFSYLHLIDNMTGADVNLLQTPSYTFDARTSDYESRFRLVFATGSSTGSDTFGFVNASGNLCIYGIEGKATVQVIDVLGHVLSSETFSGSYEKHLDVVPGVYMIRLIQGNDIRVQKMVVR